MNFGSFVMSMSLLGALFMLSILSLLDPFFAVVGLFLLLPFLIFYVLYSFGPYIQSVIKPMLSSSEPEFSFDTSTSSAYGASAQINDKVESNTTTKETKTEYETTTSATNSSNRSQSGTDSSTENSSNTHNSTTKGKDIRKAEDLLNISSPYTKKELKDSYREEVKQAHPDTSNSSKEDFKSVQNAYDLLIDKETYKTE